MPIRKRVTDPFSAEYREFNDALKHGRPPKAPRKPTAEERKPFYEAIMAIPVGSDVDHSTYMNKLVLPNLRIKFMLYGVELAIYPADVRTPSGRHRVTGVQIKMLLQNRRGIFPEKRLTGDKSIWYGEVIRWIEETCYGG